MENQPPQFSPNTHKLDTQETYLDKLEDALFQPIPVEMPSVAGWKSLELRPSTEPLVPLGSFSKNNDIFTSSIYKGEHTNSPYMKPENELEGSMTTMFAREEVVSQLRHAQQLLPEGYHLIVLDAYRSLDVQQALYDHYLNALRTEHPDWSDEALSKETQKYVSIPSTDPTKPSPHNTGGSVDAAIYRLPDAVDQRIKDIDDRLDELSGPEQDEANRIELGLIKGDSSVRGLENKLVSPTLDEAYMIEMEKIGLIRQYAEFLDFGTPFDHGDMAAWLNYLEWADFGRQLKPSEQEALAEGTLSQEQAEFIQHGFGRELTSEETEARDNRRMLYNAMTTAGMQPYEDEWWHYNSAKSQMGAQAAGLPYAEYGGTELDEDNEAHETMRAMHRAGTVKIYEGLEDNLHYGIGKADDVLGSLIRLNERAVGKTGDPRATILPEAAIIEPPKSNAA